MIFNCLPASACAARRDAPDPRPCSEERERERANQNNKSPARSATRLLACYLARIRWSAARGVDLRARSLARARRGQTDLARISLRACAHANSHTPNKANSPCTLPCVCACVSVSVPVLLYSLCIHFSRGKALELSQRQSQECPSPSLARVCCPLTGFSDFLKELKQQL